MIDKAKLLLIWAKVKPYAVYIGLALVTLLGLLFSKPKRNAVRRKTKRRTKTVTRSVGRSVPSRIKTKSGKVITGKSNVLAYKKRLSNLAKARRKLKR